MLDLSELLDRQTEFPRMWKTLVREVLMKFENSVTYHHESIAGCRPYKVDLKIIIDDCVNDEKYKELHKEDALKQSGIFLYHEVFLEMLDILGDNGLITDELKDNLKELGVEIGNE